MERILKNKIWPTGIVVFYLIFMAGIILMVKTALSTPFTASEDNFHLDHLTAEQKIEFKQSNRINQGLLL